MSSVLSNDLVFGIVSEKNTFVSISMDSLYKNLFLVISMT